MSTTGRRDAVVVVGAIIVLTLVAAYGSPFSANVKVTIAVMGISLAFAVADRMKYRAYMQDRESGELGDGATEADGRVQDPR